MSENPVKTGETCVMAVRKAQKSKEPDLHPALAMTRFKRLHRGAQKGGTANYFARCSNRTTSKTSILTLNEQRNFNFLNPAGNHLLLSLLPLRKPSLTAKPIYHSTLQEWPMFN
jgi:hypothetical protein